MKMEAQKTKEMSYVAPYVEYIEVSVETGFQTSMEGTWNEGYTEEEGSWD